METISRYIFQQYIQTYLSKLLYSYTKIFKNLNYII